MTRLAGFGGRNGRSDAQEPVSDGHVIADRPEEDLRCNTRECLEYEDRMHGRLRGDPLVRPTVISLELENRTGNQGKAEIIARVAVC